MTPRGRWPTPPDGDNTPQGKLAHGCMWLIGWIAAGIVLAGLAETGRALVERKALTAGEMNMSRAAVDMWPVRCARCQKQIGATNGNEGGLPAIYCAACEPAFIKKADELLKLLEAYGAAREKAWK